MLGSSAWPVGARMGGGGVHVMSGDGERVAYGSRSAYSTLGAPGSSSPARLSAVTLQGPAVRQTDAAVFATTPMNSSLQEQLWRAASSNSERLGYEDIEMERKGL
jgi:hypothetical protein